MQSRRTLSCPETRYKSSHSTASKSGPGESIVARCQEDEDLMAGR